MNLENLIKFKYYLNINNVEFYMYIYVYKKLSK